MKVTDRDNASVSEDGLAAAMDLAVNETEDIHSLMRSWRTVKDHYETEKAKLDVYEGRRKEIERRITELLTIPDGADKSETISIKGVGSVSKKRLVTAKVKDWEAWRKYCIRHGYGSAIRQQNNMAPVQDMYEAIMSGDLPMPQSAEFGTFDKPSFRKG